MAWTPPTSWIKIKNRYVTPEGILLRPIQTMDEARLLNSLAVLDNYKVLHVLVGRDLNEFDLAHNGNLLSIARAVVLEHGQGQIRPTAPPSTVLDYDVATQSSPPAPTTNITVSAGIVRYATKRVWRNRRLAARTVESHLPVATFAICTQAVAGYGVLNYGTHSSGQTDGSTVTGYDSLPGMRDSLALGLVTVHRFHMNETFDAYLTRLPRHLENADEREVQEKAATAIARVRSLLGNKLLSERAFIGLTHLTASAKQTWKKSGIVKPVGPRRCAFSQSAGGVTFKPMSIDWFGRMEQFNDGIMRTCVSTHPYAGDSAAFQFSTAVDVPGREEQCTVGSHNETLVGAMHRVSPVALDTVVAPYPGQTAVGVTRAPEILEVGGYVGGVPSARVFGVVDKKYVNSGTQFFTAADATDTSLATVLDFVMDYTLSEPIARAANTSDEVYYAQLATMDVDPYASFPLLPSLSHFIDVVTLTELFRLALDADLSWTRIKPFLGKYCIRELQEEFELVVA